MQQRLLQVAVFCSNQFDLARIIPYLENKVDNQKPHRPVAQKRVLICQNMVQGLQGAKQPCVSVRMSSTKRESLRFHPNAPERADP